uniref:Solute carrier family 22 member 5 n=1 Tax=Pygocentrus nattereri TaxID=42514 RepID=A0A3B4E5D8_PYGNA
MRDYDDIAPFLGTWGPYQRIVFLVLAFSILPNGFVGIYIVFVGDTPPHECLIPEEYNISEIWREAAIPMITQDGGLKRSSCTRYRVDTLRNYSMLGYIPNVDVNMTDIELESCLNGWKYSKDIYQSTIVTENSLKM